MASAPRETFPVPRESEVLLERGRVLAAAGHLNEALQALDRIRLGIRSVPTRIACVPTFRSSSSLSLKANSTSAVPKRESVATSPRE